LVAPAIAEALGIKEGADQPLAETLKNFLRDKHLLLLLDNFEQVVVASSLIAALLEAAPRLKVLVTSREILRLYGEHVFPVPPLAAPPPGLLAEGAQLGRELELLSQYAAVELFIQRAAAVKPGFSVTRENAPAVAEICARLDGLPLAIELAAARIKLFSPQALLARLDNSLTWLTGGARDLPARQQTLRAAIEWSYNLLSPDEQLIFRRVAVFAGGFTIEAAQQVAGYRLQVEGSPSDQPSIFNLQPSTFDALVSLVDKSLIQQEDDEAGEPRFTMLQTIREYALERLESSGEAAECWARHGRFFLALVEAAEPWLTSGERAVWLERLEVEHDNLRAALHRAAESGEVGLGLELAAALWWFWYFRGYYSEGRELLEAALALAEAAGESVVRAKALYAAAGLAWAQGDYGRARVLATQSVAEFGELGPAEGQAWALGILGIALLWQHDHAAARSVLEDSLKLFEKAGQTWGRAFTLFWTAMAAAMLRDETAARELLEQSLGLFRRTGDRWGISLALQALASGAMQAGDFATARALLEESLAGFRETGDNRLIAAMLEPLGHMAYAEGDIARAAELFAEGLRLHRELGNKHGIAEALRDLGDVAREQGDPRRAEALYKESLALLWDIHERAGIAACLESIGGLLVAQGDCRRAATLLGVAEALRDATEMPLPPGARASYDRTLAALRACLDGDELAAAWAAGRAMPLDRAIASATGER
ncbi:MAG TPA: tetratricopeptide repeat protein, partial [Ardenticatenaceae bacterium]|nr:tetratricopeptide repeat protein [Ardenticatenaceae bacterium]